MSWTCQRSSEAAWSVNKTDGQDRLSETSSSVWLKPGLLGEAVAFATAGYQRELEPDIQNMASGRSAELESERKRDCG